MAQQAHLLPWRLFHHAAEQGMLPLPAKRMDHQIGAQALHIIAVLTAIRPTLIRVSSAA
jgi:hypothetical protein